jgi:hypothetical protein
MVRHWVVALAVLAFAAVGAEAGGWPDAVRRLAHERSLAETCAAIIRKYGDDTQRARGALAYGEAKAEYDGVIAGLVAALAGHQGPGSLDDLQGELQTGFAEREAFCQSARGLLPAANGEKGVIADLAKGAIEPVVQALKDIFLRYRVEGEMTRKTIQAQLEDAKWLPFASVPPLF